MTVDALGPVGSPFLFLRSETPAKDEVLSQGLPV